VLYKIFCEAKPRKSSICTLQHPKDNANFSRLNSNCVLWLLHVCRVACFTCMPSGVSRFWSQGGHRGSGDGSTPGGPGAEPWWVSGGEAPRSHIYTNSLQLSNARSPSTISPHTTAKKLFRSALIPWPNTAGVGCPPVPTRGYATVHANLLSYLHWSALVIRNDSLLLLLVNRPTFSVSCFLPFGIIVPFDCAFINCAYLFNRSRSRT